MQFRLLGPWPVGQFLIPADTVIEIKSGLAHVPPAGNLSFWDTPSPFAGMAVPLPLPMEAMALDQDGADYLSTTYPFQLHQLRAGPGCVIRKIINV